MDPLNAPDESYDWYQEEQAFSQESSQVSSEPAPPHLVPRVAKDRKTEYRYILRMFVLFCLVRRF